jgi:hypothetical protein
MKNVLIFLSLGFVGISSQLANASTIVFANADDLPPIVGAAKPENGKVVAKFWSTDKPTAMFYPTNAKGEPFPAVGWPRPGTPAIQIPPGLDTLGKPEQPPKVGRSTGCNVGQNTQRYTDFTP